MKETPLGELQGVFPSHEVQFFELRSGSEFSIKYQCTLLHTNQNSTSLLFVRVR
jgi:hypothetical protein